MRTCRLGLLALLAILIAAAPLDVGAQKRGGVIRVGDEVLTPDSSRFWPADTYEVGRGQPSFDKQYVRNYLETLAWNKTPPAPALPEEVVVNTRAKYVEAYERLTGKKFE